MDCKKDCEHKLPSFWDCVLFYITITPEMVKNCKDCKSKKLKPPRT